MSKERSLGLEERGPNAIAEALDGAGLPGLRLVFITLNFLFQFIVFLKNSNYKESWKDTWTLHLFNNSYILPYMLLCANSL